MKRLLHLFSAAAVIMAAASCQQRMYFPDRAHSPGFREGGEAKLTLAVKPQTSSSDSARHGNSSSFAADFAFAPVSHFLVFGSYRGLNHRYISEEGDVFGGDFSGHRWEGGIGVFSGFDRLGKVELLLGYGNGKIQRYGAAYPDRDYHSRYSRFFIQPALGVGNEIYSVTGGIRFAYQRYYDFGSRDSALQFNIMRNTYSRDIEQEDIGFIEPFINAEIGWKYIKYNAQIGFSSQVLGGNISGAAPFYVSMGITFGVAPSYFRQRGNSRKNAVE